MPATKQSHFKKPKGQSFSTISVDIEYHHKKLQDGVQTHVHMFTLCGGSVNIFTGRFVLDLEPLDYFNVPPE